MMRMVIKSSDGKKYMTTGRYGGIRVSTKV